MNNLTPEQRTQQAIGEGVDVLVAQLEAAGITINQPHVIHALLRSGVSTIMAEAIKHQPYLKNRGDGVDGHFCIAKQHPDGYHEYWFDGKQQWCSAGTVFKLGKQS